MTPTASTDGQRRPPLPRSGFAAVARAGTGPFVDGSLRWCPVDVVASTSNDGKGPTP